MLAAVVERLPRPEAGDDVEPFVQEFRTCPAIGHLTELGPPGLGCAEPDRQDDPPAREVVEGGGFAGELPRAHPRQRRQHRPEPDPLRPHGGGGQRHPGINAPGRFPDEEAIPTSPLREFGVFCGDAGVAKGQHKSVAHRSLLYTRHRFKRTVLAGS